MLHTSFTRIKSLWLFSLNSLINWSTSGDNASAKGDPLGRGILIRPGFISSALVTALPRSLRSTCCWESLSESLIASASALVSLRFAAARLGRLLAGVVSFTESTWLVFGLLKVRFSMHNQRSRSKPGGRKAYLLFSLPCVLLRKEEDKGPPA